MNKANAEFEKLIKFFIIPCSLSYILHKSNLSFNWFLRFILIPSLLVGVFSFYDLIMQHSRESLFYQSIIMQGDMAVLLAVLLISLYSFFNNKILYCLALTGVLLSAYLSQTRGAWLALLIVMLCRLFSLYKTHQFSFRINILIGCFFLTLLLLISQTEMVSKRINEAYSDIASYVDSAKDNGFSSIGVRFELIRAGLLVFWENPLTGVGIGDSKAYFLKHDRYGFISKMVGVKNHYHNDFIQSLALRGISNFLALLFIFVSLFYIYWHRQGDTKDIILLKQTGFYFTLAVLIMGFSIPLLAGNKGIVVFTMINTCLLYFLTKRISANQAIDFLQRS